MTLLVTGCGAGTAKQSPENATAADGGAPARAPGAGASRRAPGAPVSVQAPGTVTLEEGGAVPLGLSESQLVHRLGQPAVPLRRKNGQLRCMFYEIAGQPPQVQLQYCFRGHRLRLLSTYFQQPGSAR